ncbi:MAG: glycosyltransferase family 39 protein, partial [Thermodesulfobacteriota bacterium]|nr:glycosyltransferase family 39 protein [Thermodesulfobacteriota bacterium]
MTIKERRKDWLYPLGLFLLALTLRLVFLAQITGLPYFETLFLDAQSYDAKARAILGGDWLGTKIFYQDPFYPYFLALVYKVFGPAPAAVRMVQLILGAFGPVLAYLVGRLLADRRTGILAGLFFIAYGLFYFYDGIIGKDGPGLILVMLALAALLGAAFKQRVWFWLPAGACFGLAALTRGNLLLLAPLFALWIIFAFKDSLKSRLIRVVLLALGIILVISPVTIRNWVVGRDLVLLTSQAGQNFYIGNNPRAGGFFE